MDMDFAVARSVVNPVRLFRDGTQRGHVERATFEELVEGCWDQLYRHAFYSTGNRDDAEDLLSEALIDAFRSFAQFRGQTPFARWMYRIVTTTRIDMVRRTPKLRTCSLTGALSEEGTEQIELADENADPEAIVVGTAFSEPVQNALNCLSEEFRAVIVLADIEGMDYAEVSQILGIPVGTVRSRLHRARAALRKALGEYVEL